MSTVNFADTHGYTTRTGAQGVKRASQVLSQVHHVIKHHIKNESPDKIIFVSDPDESGGQNSGARNSIYHKMGKRSADKLGYEHAPELTGKGGVVQHYVKKKKK
jgi:metallophosphoesterase superfamily enzyme